jgi:hypothetical protein
MINWPIPGVPTEYALTQQDIKEAYEETQKDRTEYCQRCVIAHVLNKAHNLEGLNTAHVYHGISYLTERGRTVFEALHTSDITIIIYNFDQREKIPDQKFTLVWEKKSV